MTRAVERTLIAFAKVPRPGRVKTRLAAAIGDTEAASLYRVMGRRVLDGVRGGDYRLVAYIDPANELARARDWLGETGIDFKPQAGDDLGERLADAFRREFQRARHVCAIGTDAPAVDRRVVERAFTELSNNDLVLGPALDGGYYLIGLSGYQPELFRGVPWSTERVNGRDAGSGAKPSGATPAQLSRLSAGRGHREELETGVAFACPATRSAKAESEASPRAASAEPSVRPQATTPRARPGHCRDGLRRLCETREEVSRAPAPAVRRAATVPGSPARRSSEPGPRPPRRTPRRAERPSNHRPG